MTITLYGVYFSPPYNAVRIVLRELGLPFKEVELSKGEPRSPKYKDVVPFGQIPWIDDDGLVVYESRAACRYLLLRYGNNSAQKLLPSFSPSTDEEWKALTKFEQAVCVEQHQFNAHIQGVMTATFYKTLNGQLHDLVALGAALEKIEAVMDVYEIILSKQKYIAGDKLTLADLLHIPYGHQIDLLGLDRVVVANPKRPNVLRWWAEISARDSYAGLGITAITDAVQKIAKKAAASR